MEKGRKTNKPLLFLSPASLYNPNSHMRILWKTPKAGLFFGSTFPSHHHKSIASGFQQLCEEASNNCIRLISLQESAANLLPTVALLLLLPLLMLLLVVGCLALGVDCC